METSRDDFSIAIRSAFLRKDTRQKFSLLALIIVSIVLLYLETINTKAINVTRYFIKDVIYRVSAIASIPGDISETLVDKVKTHFFVYQENEILRQEIQKIKSEENQINYLKAENKKLARAIEANEMTEYESVISKVMIDKESPFLKSVVINKGFKSDLKKGMPVLDGAYLIGRLTEVNYLSSRVLLISDLNSKIPVIIEPNGYNAIMSGDGDERAILDFLPRNHEITIGNFVYTSGTDGIFRPGIPIGKVEFKDGKYLLNFSSDLTQLYLVNVVVSEQIKYGE